MNYIDGKPDYLYRVVPKDAKGFINWKIGYQDDNLFRKYYVDSAQKAIDAYTRDFHDDPFEFALSLDSYMLLTWKVVKDGSAFAEGILISINRLDETGLDHE